MKSFFLSALLLMAIIPAIAQLTPQQAAPLMQKGINLGNTLEPPFEGDWAPAAQEYFFDLYRDAGFNTVRVPVRWDEHTQDSVPYSVSGTWMNRVEQIVDWALQRDLFVIINAHHEEWIKANYSNAGYRARFDSIWSQISARFKDKSDRLLFEIINEPYGLTKAQNDELHARILSIIRKTNPTRLVVIQGHNWGGSEDLIAAAIPNDNYIMGSFHSYDPYLFGLQRQGTWGTTTDYNNLKTKFQLIKNWSDTNHIPILLGEFGSLRRCDYNSRMKHYRAYVEYAQQFGFVSCAWDDGGDFKIMERSAKTWDEVKDILINTNSIAPRNLDLKIIEDTVIQVSWVNAVSDADSIYIEHRLPTGKYDRIAVLKGDTTYFLHHRSAQNLYHHYRIIAHYNSGSDYYSQPMRIYLPEYVPKFRSFYLNHPVEIPGTVEAEFFDAGGEGLTYHDITANNIYGKVRPDEGVDIYSGNSIDYYVGYMAPDEWMEYTVNVQKPGRYIIDFHIAAYQAGGTFKLTVIGDKQTDTLTAPSSNSLIVSKIISDTIELNSGEQILRFTTISDQPSFNLDKMVFTEMSDPVSTGTTDIQPISVVYNKAGYLQISWEPEKKIDFIRLYSINGAILVSDNHPENEYSISTEGFPAGPYLLNVCSGKEFCTLKIVLL